MFSLFGNLTRTVSSLLAVAIVSGCSGPALKGSFLTYSSVYAEASNHQLLLNLARASNGHPPYFVQLGQINSIYTFSANILATLADTLTGVDTSSSLLGSGSLGAAVSEQPSFNYVPLGGAEFSQAVLVPVDPKVFYTLFQQGYPVDQLLRLLVQSIELDIGGVRQTFTNTPDLGDPRNFRDFLVVCGVARELQKRGLLTVETTSSVEEALSPAFERVTVQDALKAAQGGFFLKEEPRSPGQRDPAAPERRAFPASPKYRLARMREETGLKLAASARKAMDEIGRDRRFRIETRGGVSAAGAQVDGINIQLRPFFNVLHAAGNEAAIFDEIVTNKKKQGRDFLADIPPSQHRRSCGSTGAMFLG